MSKQIVEVVLPRLARPLYRQLHRFRAGELDEPEFARSFEALLRRQHAWLTQRGVSDVQAALAIHGAVLVLSSPGLRAEAAETGIPLELLEHRAVCDAAVDVANNYGIHVRRAFNVIARIVARYSH